MTFINRSLAVRRPAFETFWNTKHVNGKLVLFEAQWTEGRDGYDPNLKVSQNVEMVDASKIKGYAAPAIARLLKKVKTLVEYVPCSITEGICSCMAGNGNVMVESNIRIAAVQLPLVVERCTKIVKGKRCQYKINGGSCGKGHETSEYPSFLKIGIWLYFLDSDIASSHQRRAWVRPEAFSALTGVSEKEILKMNIGFQETIADGLKGGVFRARFVINKRFIQLVSFIEN